MGKKKGGNRGKGQRRPSQDTGKGDPQPETQAEVGEVEGGEEDVQAGGDAAAGSSVQAEAPKEAASSSSSSAPAAVEGPAETVPAEDVSGPEEVPPADAGPKLPDGLAANYDILSADEKALAQLLLGAGQAHLFDDWAPAGTDDDKKHAFFAQVKRLHESYPFPGGLAAYLERARTLLAASREGANPLAGWTPSVPPDGATLEPASKDYEALEEIGKSEIAATAFVLVAGGLGERLGFSGIKVALPTELTTGVNYISYYLKYLEALQAKFGQPMHLAIMVSDDTHDRTVALLESHDYYGFPRDQLTIMKQEKVAALTDNDAHIARAEGSKYELDCKPHGHGDVHSLLHSTGVAKKWLKLGKKWVVFFQDTNAMAFFTLAPALGVSKKLDLEVNSLAIPRVPKQAVGAITKLTHKDGQSMIVNVEYNQLEPLLKASVNPEGDVADPATGMSPYPGNINQLVFKLDPYVAMLEKTHGVMGEFVNPKYADASKTVFKKPTRLECMMQDYPKVLAQGAKVGFTTAPAWITFSPVKNNAADAAKAAATGIPPGSASSGEADQYYVVSELLRRIGAKVESAAPQTYLGITVTPGPKVVLSPSFAATLSELKTKVPKPSDVSISGKSTLVIDGAGVVLESLQLDGALVIEVPEGTEVVVSDVSVKNKGWSFAPVAADETDEVLRMRGYRLVKDETAHVKAPAKAGRLYLTPDLKLVSTKPTKAPPAAPSPPPEPEVQKVAAVQPAAPVPVAPPAQAIAPVAVSAPSPAPTAPAVEHPRVDHDDDEVTETCFSRLGDCFRSKKRSHH